MSRSFLHAIGGPSEIEHGSESSHVQSVHLLNEAGKLGLIVGRNCGDHSTQVGSPNVGHLNGAHDGGGLVQREFQMQDLSGVKGSVSPKLKSFFR